MVSKLQKLLFAAYSWGAVGQITAQQQEAAFEAFTTEYKKTYATTLDREKAFSAFKTSLAYVEKENAKQHLYKVGINEFADVSQEKFMTGRLGLKQPPSALHLGTHQYSGAALPESVDWVEKGAVTDVKNQGQCGSCWTFSTTGALEGAWQIATGELVSLSEQQFVDCSKNDGNHGCSGGSMDGAFKYIEDNNPVCTEESYAYTMHDGATCSQASCTDGIPAGKVTGFKDVTVEDTDALMEAVSQQPVSVGIEADQLAFQLYKGGILTGDCGASLDHGVLIVGYGSEDGVDYWKVKNSWGASWGENGYVRVQRGKSQEGECGIKLMASYPVIAATGAQSVIVV